MIQSLKNICFLLFGFLFIFAFYWCCERSMTIHWSHFLLGLCFGFVGLKFIRQVSPKRVYRFDTEGENKTGVVFIANESEKVANAIAECWALEEDMGVVDMSIQDETIVFATVEQNETTTVMIHSDVKDKPLDIVEIEISVDNPISQLLMKPNVTSIRINQEGRTDAYYVR